MPWLKTFGRVVRPSLNFNSSNLEKLEDRIAVAATATLAASGLIFDGAEQQVMAAPKAHGAAAHAQEAHAQAPKPHHQKKEPDYGKGAASDKGHGFHKGGGGQSSQKKHHSGGSNAGGGGSSNAHK